MLSIIRKFLKKNTNDRVVDARLLQLIRKTYLKAEASRPIPPREPCNTSAPTHCNSYSIGYSYNLLNNAYVFCKIARQNGIDAKLFLEPNFADIMITSLPYWEDNWLTCKELPHNNSSDVKKWKNPEFVKSAQWDLDILKTINIEFEYDKMQNLLKNAAINPPQDEISYLMAYSVLGHRKLLELYNGVDILHVSGTHIGLASFSNKPYVTFPFGDDLYDVPFQNTEIGWMQARGFHNAKRHIISGKCMLDYCDALHIDRSKIDLLPFMVNTDDYAPINDNHIRKEFSEKHQDKLIFLAGARQNWYWKGNDKLFRAISRIRSKYGSMAVFLVAWYGQDVDKSEKLIKELGIEDCIVKMEIMSKSVLRYYIDASDVCIDQFTLGSLGTFSLESMSIGTPLITHFRPERHFSFEEEPPLMNAFSEDEICAQLVYCINSREKLSEMGIIQRNWLKKYHGHEKLWPLYDECYRKALKK